jgi:hypothetical protein
MISFWTTKEITPNFSKMSDNFDLEHKSVNSHLFQRNGLQQNKESVAFV